MFWKLKEMFFLSSKMIAIIALAISLFAALISVFTLWHQVKPEQAQVSSDLSLAKEKLEDMVSDFESRLRTGFETQDDFIVSLKEQIRAELNDIKSASARDKEQGQVSVSKTDRNYLDVRISRLEDSIKAIQPVNEDLNRDMNFLGTQDDLSAGLFAASGLLAANNSGMPLDHWVIFLKQINDGGYNLTYLNELEKAVRSDPPDFEQLMRVARELVPEMAQALNSAKADSGFAEQLLADFRKLVKLRPINVGARGDAGTLLRFEQAVEKNDLGEAIRAVSSWQNKPSEKMDEWLVKAKSREVLDNAIASVVDEILSKIIGTN